MRRSRGGHANLAVGGRAPLLQLAPLGVGLLTQALRPGRAFRLLRLLRLAVLPHLSGPRQLEYTECMRLVPSKALSLRGQSCSIDTLLMGHSDSLFDCFTVASTKKAGIEHLHGTVNQLRHRTFFCSPSSKQPSMI